MKRIILTLAFTAMIIALKAQSGSTIAQPGEFTARRINTSGEVTLERQASFSYCPDGKLEEFLFPDYNIISEYYYDENNFITQVFTSHDDGGVSGARYTYYEDGKLKMVWTWDQEGYDQFKYYYYYEDGRLARVNYSDYNLQTNPDSYYSSSYFEYENGGKTRVETCYGNILEGTHWTWGVVRISTRHYNDNYNLVSEQTDYFNVNGGEFTESQRTLYTYTPDGNLETVVKQTLADDEWINNTIHLYFYDEDDRVAEQHTGTWSEELNDWNINKKSVHEYSNDGLVYTVSLYKKSGDEWVWDIYNGQNMFFEPELNEQQKALAPFSYEINIGQGYINQFEFHMVYTERPTYMKVGEDSAPVCAVYPNPGNGQVRIEAPTEDCVVRFYDLNGRLILAKPFDFGTDVATDDWTPGLYLWEIWNGTQRQASGKWVKE